MAVQKEQAQIDVIINGQKATGTIKEMEASLKILNTQIKNLTPGTQAFVDKAAEIQKLNAKLSETKAQVKGVSAETKNLTEEMVKVGPASGIFQQFNDTLSASKQGFSVMVNGLGTVKGAVAATGIGALILAVVSLLQYFKKTDEGATRLEGVMAALGAIADVLTENFVKFGKVLFDAFENPKKGLKDFVEFIKNNAISRFEGLLMFGKAIGLMFKGEFSEAAKVAADATIQLTTGVQDGTDKIAALVDEAAKAAAEAYNLAAAFDAIADAERSYSVDTASAETQIARLLLQAKNRSRTEEERLDLLREAAKIEKEDFDKNFKLQQQKLALIQQENKALRARGNDTDEMAQKEADQAIKIEGLKRASIELTEKITNREVALLDEIAAKRVADAEAAKKLKEDEFKDLIKQVSDANKMVDSIAKAKTLEEQKALVNNLDYQNSLIFDNALERILFEAEQADKIEQIQLDALQAKQNNLIANNLANTEEFRANAMEMEKIEIESVKRQTALEKELYAAKKAFRERDFKAASDIVTASTNIFSSALTIAGANEEEFAEFQKGVTLAKIAISTAQAISSLVAASSANPANAVTFGAAGAAQFATGLGQIIANIAQATQILSGADTPSAPTPKSFYYGGEVGGSKHGRRYGQAGIRLIDRLTGQEKGEMEGGEIILTGGVARNPRLRRAASQINVMGGGRSFAAGGEMPSSNGSTEVISQQGEMNNALLAQIAQGLANLTKVTAEKQLNISIQEIRKKEALETKIQEKANS